MNRLYLSLLLTLVLFAAPASATAFFSGDAYCYTVADDVNQHGGDADGRTDGLFKINPFTGSEHFVATTGTEEIEALAYDPDTGRLYTADRGTFGKIDPETGHFTVIGSLGEGYGSEGKQAFNDIDGMAIDPVTKKIYASVRRSGTTDLLIIVDKYTGKAVKGAFGGSDYVVVKANNGMGDVDDLAFLEDGTLYGIQNGAGYYDRLSIIDKATGKITDKGRIKTHSGTELDNFEAFSITPKGKLIGIRGGSKKEVYEIDRHTARATLLSTLDAASDYESLACFIKEAEEADLEVHKVVNNPVPRKGDVVTFTVSLHNKGPLDATNVRVKDLLPDGLTYVSHGSGPVQAWDGSYNAYSGIWEIAKVKAGYTATLVVNARVDTKKGVENCAEVTRSDQPDNDSTPNNGKDEDDRACACVAPSGSSGGHDAGIESNGDMATLMANRRFRRDRAAAEQQGLRANLILSPHAMAEARQIGVMEALIPAEGPLDTRPFVTSPGDLVGLTNAQRVYAVDYLRQDQQRIGAIFAASTTGEVYDHSKTTCDRLGGGALEAVRLVEVAGYPFVLSLLRQPTGEIDYAISFVAARTGNSFVIDSRFTRDEYAVPVGTEEVINFQIWTAAPQLTMDLLANVLEEMQLQGNVSFRNTGEQTPVAPLVFVKNGRYEEGRLVLNVANMAGAGTLTVNGTAARSETAADAGQREAFSRTIALPEADESGIVTVEVPVGYVFDATFYVSSDLSPGADQLYYADGPWSYATDQNGAGAAVTTFETFAETGTVSTGAYRIERAAHVSGSVASWASLFRYFTTSGQPVDFSAYDAIEFTAYGNGEAQLVLEKAGITNWDHFGTTFTLTPSTQTYRIPFSELAQANGTGGFTAEDLTLLAFYINGNGQTAKPFTLVVQDVRFVNSAATPNEGETALPTTATLEANYPNPFATTTTLGFTLPQAGPVRLTVYDVLGREVSVLADEVMPAGTHTLTFDASDLPAGTYVYRLETEQGTQTRRMVRMK